MKTFSSDRELYLAYRLGELPAQERRMIEDRILMDDEFSDRMQEAEYDLLDDYRAGRLNFAVRLRVERSFSRDELRQPLPCALRTNGQYGIAPSGSAPRFSLALRFACAVAALVLIAVAGWVVTARLHPGAEPPSSAARTSPAPSSSPQNSGKPPAQTATTSPQLPGDTAVLLLAPSVTRGGSAAQLELSPAIRNVTVQWVVPSDLAGGTFSLLVQQKGKELALVPASDTQHISGSDVEEFSLPRTVFSAAGTHVLYVFLVRRSSPTPATEAEFTVSVAEDFNH